MGYPLGNPRVEWPKENNIVIYSIRDVTNGIKARGRVDVFDRDVETYNGGECGMLQRVLDIFLVTTHFKVGMAIDPIRTLQLSVPRREQSMDG